MRCSELKLFSVKFGFHKDERFPGVQDVVGAGYFPSQDDRF